MGDMSASNVEQLAQTINENSVITIQDDKSGSSSPQPVNKFSTKIKDLERILAKCKESLKQKNAQIKVLKETLSELDDFKEYNQELKRELGELRESHESWTVSIAENKRLMHQELESKNNDIERLKSEAKELQHKLNDSYNNIRQLKSAIHDLESRLVSTSAAHQRERENLMKELTSNKNDAIRQCQKESELQLERVKLDLEKSIEALKVQLLAKDEHLVKTVTEQQDLEDKNRNLELELETLREKLAAQPEEEPAKDDQADDAQRSQEIEKFQQEIYELNARLGLMTTANDDQEKEIKSLRQDKDTLNDNLRAMRFELEEMVKKNESLARVIHENESELQSQQDQLDRFSSMHQELDMVKKENHSLRASMNQLKAELNDRNSETITLKNQTEGLGERVDSLKAQLETANKLVDELRRERDSMADQNEKLNKQRRDLDEQLVVRILSTMKNLETPNNSPGSDKSSVSSPADSNESADRRLPDPLALLEDLSSIALDRCNTYMTASQRLQAVLLDNSVMSEELNRLREEISDLNKEKILENQCSLNETEELRTENQALVHDQQAYEEKIKYLESEIASRDADCEESKAMLSSYNKKVDDLEARMSTLSATLESKDELISKLTGEIEGLHRELEAETSIEKPEVDDKAGEIIVNQLREENESLKQSIGTLNAELESVRSSNNASDHTYQLKALQRVLQQYQEENQRLKETQKNLTEQLNRDPMSLPDSTQFEYLKNIVYQFMLGREPLVLARVISAVFKFDKNQIDQICKRQETVQAALRSGN